MTHSWRWRLTVFAPVAVLIVAVGGWVLFLREAQPPTVEAYPEPQAAGDAGGIGAAVKTQKDPVEVHDALEVDVHGQPDLKRRERVRADGKITPRFLGDVHVLGLTPLQIEEKLTKLYSEYIVGVKVTVKPITGRIHDIYVVGAVSREGLQVCQPGMTVSRAIVNAGGLTLRADPKAIKVVRGNKMWKVNLDEVVRGGNKELDILLEPDDVVFVPLSAATSKRKGPQRLMTVESSAPLTGPDDESVARLRK